ncbi:MAG: response regulator [Bacteroidales bacterium]
MGEDMMLELKKILLAEDNPMDVELTLAAMEESNLVNRVVVVRDGVETLEYLRREGPFADRDPGLPAVLLLDIKMPRKDGIEVLREIRGDPQLRLLPVVMLTSSREDRDLLNSYVSGVNAYVVKPVNFDGFLEAIKQLGMFWGVVNQLPPEV